MRRTTHASPGRDQEVHRIHRIAAERERHHVEERQTAIATHGMLR